MEVEHILIGMRMLKLENPQIVLTLFHLMLLFLEHDKGIEHIVSLEHQHELNDDAVRTVDDRKDKGHYSKSKVILVSPEAFTAIEITLKIKLFVNRLILVLDTLCQQSFENLRAIYLPNDDVIVR